MDNNSAFSDSAASGVSSSDSEVSVEQVMDALRSVQDPDLHKDIVSLGMVKDVRICGSTAAFTVVLTTPACPLKEQIEADCRDAVLAIDGIDTVSVDMSSNVTARRGGPGGERFAPGVKHVIAVGSGKGGVGKSTVAANLAIALAQMGARVGLMDADIYGPTVPILLGIEDADVEQTSVTLASGEVVQRLLPVYRHGIGCISIGFLIPPGQPVVWRGPMLASAVTQFLRDVEWGELDYLLVDLPPGTGDVSMTLAQSIPLTGAVVVMTPQDVAASIAVKAVRMFQKLDVPILGIVENMSYFIAPDTGTAYHIFGQGGGREAAEELETPFLGEIPLDIPTRVGSDEGEPVTAAQPESAQAVVFQEIARQLAAQVSIQNSDTQSMPLVAG